MLALVSILSLLLVSYALSFLRTQYSSLKLVKITFSFLLPSEFLYWCYCTQYGLCLN